MDYFAHIENRHFMRWQTDILYESLRLLNQQDNFCLAYSHPASGQVMPAPTYPRAFEVPHVGAAWGNVAMTKPYSLMVAIRDGHIKQPCTLIDVDTFFKTPIEVMDAPITCQWWNYMVRNILENDRGFGRFPTKRWWPIGSVYQFRDAPPEIFDEIVYCVKLMAETFKKGDGRLKEEADYWQCEMVGMALGVAKCLDAHPDVRLDLVKDFESQLGSTEQTNMVHYCNHYPPFFFKRAFDERINPDCGFPYNLILSLPEETDNIVAFKRVTRSLVERTMATRTTKAYKVVVESEIRCSEETAFVVKDGSSVKSKDLKPGDLMLNGNKVVSVTEDGTTEVWENASAPTT